MRMKTGKSNGMNAEIIDWNNSISSWNMYPCIIEKNDMVGRKKIIDNHINRFFSE